MKIVRTMLLAATLVAAGMSVTAQAAHAATKPDSGYWMLTADGRVFGFGAATDLGDGFVVNWAKVDIEPTPSGFGYWIVNGNGTIEAFGDAFDYSPAGLTGVSLNTGELIVSMSATPKGQGYWLFTDQGRVFPFGDAQSFGDLTGIPLNGKVLDSVPTPSGLGYWMVASDGGIFTFGDAKFEGSTGNIKLNKPVMSMAPDPDGVGYWLVASDGGIFTFGAEFYGSMGGTRLNKPVTGMVAGPTGYLMVAEDGGIFSFGTTAFHGSLGAAPPSSPVVAVAVIDNVRGFADGVHLVGVDIQPGTYRTTVAAESCYWARLSGTSGAFDDIIANDLGEGPRVVTISATDVAFESSRCGAWTDILVPMTTSSTTFGDGVFIVGLDIAPGTYRTGTTDGCYWARLSGFGGDFEEIIANDLGDGQRLVTVAASDRGLETSRCGTWTKVG